MIAIIWDLDFFQNADESETKHQQHDFHVGSSGVSVRNCSTTMKEEQEQVSQKFTMYQQKVLLDTY